MSQAEPLSRGQPVRFLLLLLAGWTGFRLIAWQAPWVDPPLLAAAFAASSAAPHTAMEGSGPPAAPLASQEDVRAIPVTVFAKAGVPARHWPAARWLRPDRGTRVRLSSAPAKRGPPQAVPLAALRPTGSSNGSAAGEPMRALSQVGGYPSVPAPAGKARPARWHVDGWLQLRRSGGSGFAQGLSDRVLGGSQAGLVARYGPGGLPLDAQALVRLAFEPSQNGMPSRQEAGVGLRIRPVQAIPVVAQIEVRAVSGEGGLRIVPVALVAGGFDDRRLAGPVRVRAYGEAGYAGGAGATAFAYGQAAAEARLLGRDGPALDAGIGAWGGAQADAERLDIGPVLSARAPLGAGFVRLQLDYRVRVAGAALPARGPALTLSTSF